MKNPRRKSMRTGWRTIPLALPVVVVAGWRFGPGIADHFLSNSKTLTNGVYAAVSIVLLLTGSILGKRINSIWNEKHELGDRSLRTTILREGLAGITGVSTIALIFVARELYDRLPESGLVTDLVDYGFLVFQLAVLVFVVRMFWLKYSKTRE